MFLSCGDALFDLFARPGDDVGGIRLDGHVGGSPLNVAVGLARMGNRVGYLCKNSGDLFGTRIRDFLDRNGVDPDWVVPTELNSTLAIVQTDDTGAASYVFHVNGTADVSLEVPDLPSALPDDLDVLHVGSYSTAVEPCATALLELARRERGRRLISYDPNVRLPIEPDLDVWRERFRLLAACVDVLKASDEDVAALGGASDGAAVTEAEIEHFARDAIDLGVSLVAITRGNRGARLHARDGRRAKVEGIDVEVRDTVGAGDTFQAAMLHWLKAHDTIENGTLALDGADLADLGAFAASAAAITCTRSGADLPDLADIERFRAAHG